MCILASKSIMQISALYTAYACILYTGIGRPSFRNCSKGGGGGKPCICGPSRPGGLPRKFLLSEMASGAFSGTFFFELKKFGCQ